MNNIVSGDVRGGLGNQLFVIAIVLEYARKFKKKVVFKERKNEGVQHENTQLSDIFKNVSKIKILDEEEYGKIKFDKIINDNNDIYSINKLEKHNGNILFDGAFLSYNNFSEKTEKEITKYIYNMMNKNYYHIAKCIYEKIKKDNNDDNDDNYMFIHIRRTDFIICDRPTNLDYFNKAMKILNGKKKKIIVFSDDIEWCKDNLKLNKNQIFIDFINNRYIELILMSFIKNGIPAQESTYSTWGAYLGENDKKIVVAKMSCNNSYSIDPKNERYPKEWIVI